MKSVKRQHIVPRAYLKGFTPDGKFLWFFDKKSLRSKKVTMRHVAVSDNFYDISDDVLQKIEGEVDPTFVDKFLTSIEGDYATSLRETARLKVGDVLTQRQKRDMAFFMALQFMRTVEMRESLFNSRTAFVQQLCNDLTKLNFPPEVHYLTPIASYDRSSASALHALFITDPEVIGQVAQRLHSHIWQLGVSNSNAVLYTSDSPVVRRTVIPRVFARPEPLQKRDGQLVSQIATNSLYPGVAEPGIEIAFPLSSHRVLLLRDRAHFSLRGAEDNLVVALSLEEVQSLNRLQVEQSYRQVFCEKQEFDLSIQYCQNNPGCRDENRFCSAVSSSISLSQEAVVSLHRPQQNERTEGE